MDHQELTPFAPSRVNISTQTFGCKVNTYDSGLIEKNLFQSGLFSHVADSSKKIHILNTCAVTAEATKEAVKLISRIKKESPEDLVVITGCSAQVDTQIFIDQAQADLVVANSHKSQLPQIIDQYLKGHRSEVLFKSNIFKKEDLEIGGGIEAEHTRSFLKIQDGCNSFCSFCIIPYARGKSRSISVTELSNRVIELYEAGHREVVLTGVHIGDYADGSRQLDDLVEALLKRTPMPRFRLSSLEPIEISDRLLELYQDTRMCPHFHMSIQSANSKVLKDMKRQYSQTEVRNMLIKISNKIKNPFIGMDVIAGFPTETFEDFEDTYLALADIPWTRLHVFPYSERKGTRANDLMEQVPYGERKNRARRLRDLSQIRYQEWGHKQVGEVQSALLLKKITGRSHGLTREYCNIKLSDEALQKVENYKGQEVSVQLNKFHWNSGSTQDGHFEAQVLI